MIRLVGTATTHSDDNGVSLTKYHVRNFHAHAYCVHSSLLILDERKNGLHYVITRTSFSGAWNVFRYLIRSYHRMKLMNSMYQILT